MKILRKTFILLIVFSLVFSTANAMSAEVEFDYELQTLRIEAEGFNPYEAVSVRISKIVSEEKLDKITSQNIADVICYANVFDADNAGNLNESIGFSGEKSLFSIVMSSSDGATYEDSFATLDDEDKKDIFNRIKACVTQYNSAIDDTGSNNALKNFIDIIDEFYPVYDLLYTKFDDLGETAKKLVATQVLKTGIDDVLDLEALFNNNTALQYISTKSTEESFIDDIDELKKHLICLPAISYYDSLKNDQKAKAISLDICDFESYDDLCDSLSASLLRHQINSVTWTYAEGVLGGYEDYIQNKLSSLDLRASSQKFKELIAANKQIIKFNTIDDYINQSNNSSSSSSGSSGSGGGGKSTSLGSGGSTSVYIPSSSTQNIEQNLKFEDLENVSWAKESIDYLYNEGIISGRSQTVFDPLSGVTREEFIKMLVGTIKLDVYNVEVPFVDLDKNAWYYNYIATAVDKGLIKGVSETEYGIGKQISRQDIVTIIYRTLADENKDYVKVEFKDSDLIAPYAQKAVEFAYEIGLVKGDEKGFFNPDSNITRAESAVVLHRLMLYVKGGR